MSAGPRKAQPKDFNDYASRFSQRVRRLLKSVRSTIKEAAPDAEEAISYGIPAFRQGGILVWFAAHEHHIGFYPRASAIAAFKKELKDYMVAKGSEQFPFDAPLPLDLVDRSVRFRLKEAAAKSGV